ncbi:outer membrane protein assembly factor BamB family protein [Sphingomonas nostoxanthinifaciens]|uniref:outer membrane protein assembly factor BamB family protein n=1 Tax=Sphingomonas nostoxanthinifaciens TaxID=2872652 RepID=UPI001CC1DC14|nr:PQQ-binding-like beta-propeller repeat protein [Sphingomonas nostoxanthinifaciens]
MRKAAQTVMALTILLSGAMPTAAGPPPAGDWWSFGRDVAGTRFSPLRQINPANVARLARAWSFDFRPSDAKGGRLLVSNMIPVAIGGIVYVATPYGRLVALDGDTGAVRWSYVLPDDDRIAGRALEYWPGDRDHGARIFFGTRSGKMLAVELRTGRPPAEFMPIELRTPDVMNGVADGGYQINSSPILYDNVLITGAKVQESPALGTSGDVRGWDARTGRLLWTFHAVPHAGERFNETWGGDSWRNRSGVNVWTSMTVDSKRGIVYLPFGAPAYDRVGIDRPGANLYANALVALDARTGRFLWQFQAVHHDVWDLDMPAQPTLMDVRHDGRTIPAVVAMTKAGYLFILDRVTGTPIFPVTETPMPASTIPGEHAWPTQPIPSSPPPLIRQSMTAADITDLTPELQAFCRNRVATEHASFAVPFEPLRADHPVVRFPGSGGGPNWGGGALDQKNGLYIVNTNDLPSIEQMGKDAHGNWYNVAPRPSWFGMGGLKLLCQKPPWGSLTAVDLNKGTIAWQVPLGVTDSLPLALRGTGRPNVGGPLLTASGLIFIGATDDSRFRAFDEHTGREMWTVRLDASAHATPISYAGRSGRQYVAIVSAGGSFLGSPATASRLVVFALPKEGEAPVPEAAATGVAPAAAPAAPEVPPPAAMAAAGAPTTDFRDGPERALVQKACTVCHVASQVTNQRHTKQEWATLVEKMIGFGAQVHDDQYDAIVNYLARNYPSEPAK